MANRKMIREIPPNMRRKDPRVPSTHYLVYLPWRPAEQPEPNSEREAAAEAKRARRRERRLYVDANGYHK